MEIDNASSTLRPDAAMTFCGETMNSTIGRFSPTRCFSVFACTVVLTALNGNARPALKAQSGAAAAKAPDLSGVWDGTRRAHPINGPAVPWAQSVPEGTILPDG